MDRRTGRYDGIFWGVALGVAAGLLSAGCGGEITEIVVVASTDLRPPGEADRIEIDVEGPSGQVRTAVGDIGPGALSLPVTLGVTPEANLSASIVVRGFVLRGSDGIVRSMVETSFLPGARLRLDLPLLADCGACPPDERCTSAGTCTRDTRIDPTSLSAF
jgi:hypothetical protein